MNINYELIVETNKYEPIGEAWVKYKIYKILAD